MDKLKMHTPDLAAENYKKLAALFPNAVTETIAGYDENGNAIVERAIDADVLRQEVAVYRDEADYVRAQLYGKIAPNLETVLTADRPGAPFGLPFKDAGPKSQVPSPKKPADGPKAQ